MPQAEIKFLTSLSELELTHSVKQGIFKKDSKHFHECFSFGVSNSGVTKFAYAADTYYMGAGEINVIHPGEVHKPGAAQEGKISSYYALYPSTSLINKIASKEDVFPSGTFYFPERTIKDKFLANLFLKTCHTLTSPQYDLLAKEELVYLFILSLIMRHARGKLPVVPPSANQALIKRIYDYIHINYSRQISLTELSDIVHLSPSQMLRIFKKTTGISPYAYLLNVRINHSKCLLKRGTSVGQTAYETGFFDQSHLHRYFKKVLQITPAQYQRSCYKNAHIVQDYT